MVCADTITYLILSALGYLRLVLQSQAQCQKKIANADSKRQEATTILLALLAFLSCPSSSPFLELLKREISF